MHSFHKQMTTPLATERALNTLLERNVWLPSLKTNSAYSRRHDDTDGERGDDQNLAVFLSPDTDAFVQIGDKLLRFREPFGGGLSPRTRNALLVLAEAIRRDNEEFPQKL